ncbi:hypothetical protein [Endothiovibrio diazotrophicus]
MPNGSTHLPLLLISLVAKLLSAFAGGGDAGLLQLPGADLSRPPLRCHPAPPACGLPGVITGVEMARRCIPLLDERRRGIRTKGGFVPHGARGS